MRAWIAVLLVGCAGDLTPPGAPRCSGMQMLADRFAGAALSSRWQASTSAPTITATTGDGLALALADPGDAAVAAARFFDLRNDHFSVAVDADGPGGEITLRLGAAVDPANALTIVRDRATLRFVRDEDGQHTELAALPYDPVAHRYWRIEETADATIWSTSADGVVFAVQATTRALPWATYMQPALSAHRDATEGPLVATFRDVDGGAPTGSACVAAELADDFSAPAIADHWRWSATRGSLSPQDGRLEAYYPPGGQQVGIRIGSSTIYDLRGGAFAFELPNPIPSPVGVHIAVTTLDGWQAGFDATGGNLNATYLAPTATTPPSPIPPISHVRSRETYDPIADRWLRIRESGDILHWETSADGVSYSVLAQHPNFPGLDGVAISFLFNGSGDSYYTPTVIAVDNFNTGP